MKYLLILFFLATRLFAQVEFQVEVDYATFPVDDKIGIIELYYSFAQGGLKPIVADEKKSVSGLLKVFVTNADTRDTVLNRSWNFNTFVDTGLQSKSLIGLLRFQFDAGNYKCRVVGSDNNQGSSSKTINFDFIIKPLVPERFTISDVQLASSILQDSQNKGSMFYKNTLELTPNPSGVYGKNVPVLFFYSEVHNVDVYVESEFLKIDHILVNSRSEPIYRKSKFVSRKNKSIVDIGAVPVHKYPTGVYNLLVSATDTVLSLTRTSLKQFFIFNPDLLDTTSYSFEEGGMLASEISFLSIDELDVMFEQASYIAKREENSTWEKISTLEGKRNFLFDFWLARDEVPSTAKNEQMIDYYERVKYANDKFGNLMQKEGWKTDFGRVHIMYGKPYEIERYPNQLDMKPYEIWFYSEIEGGVSFIFADYTGFGEYRLIHSDKNGELADPDWYSKVLVN